MRLNLYLHLILRKYTRGSRTGREKRAELTIRRTMSEWAGQKLAEIYRIGSLAKGTAIAGGTDIDLFVLLKHSVQATLGEIYQSAYDWLTRRGYSARKQNVSVGVVLGRVKIDVVPGKRQAALGTRASLYKSKTGTWTQTWVGKQLEYVKASGRQKEIRLVKIWRDLRGLQFPSFAVELAVIEALKGRMGGHLAEHLTIALTWIAHHLRWARLEDPGNRANDVADDMTVHEKAAVASAAAQSLVCPSLNQVVW